MNGSGVELFFGPFSLDVEGEQLWSEREVVPLRAKSFAVLRYLVERAERLVRKEEVLAALWGDVTVGDDVLKTSVKEIRRALGDSARSPRFVETVHGRGYRFIGAVRLTPRVAPTVIAADPRGGSGWLVPRVRELSVLAGAYEQVLAGERRAVFVEGAPGSGKSTLLDLLIARNEDGARTLVARARCLEQRAAGEPYLPILEALGGVFRTEHGGALRAALERAAPRWLECFVSVQRLAAARMDPQQAATRSGSMLRELAAALESLTRRRPVLLCLEELQLADEATLDLVHYLALCPDLGGLLLLCSHTPLDGGLERDRRLRGIERNLCERTACTVLELSPFDHDDVARYLERRFPEHCFPAQLAPLICERSGGKPAFVVKLLDDWLAQGSITRTPGGWVLQAPIEALNTHVPAAIALAIEAELERLSARQLAILEAAAALGGELTSTEIALALDLDPAQVERECSQLARARRFLRFGTWRGQSGAACVVYAFVQPLAREVLRENVGLARRAQLLGHLGWAERGPVPRAAADIQARAR